MCASAMVRNLGNTTARQTRHPYRERVKKEGQFFPKGSDWRNARREPKFGRAGVEFGVGCAVWRRMDRPICNYRSTRVSALRDITGLAYCNRNTVITALPSQQLQLKLAHLTQLLIASTQTHVQPTHIEPTNIKRDQDTETRNGLPTPSPRCYLPPLSSHQSQKHLLMVVVVRQNSSTSVSAPASGSS